MRALKALFCVFLSFGLCLAWMDQRPVLESQGGNLLISSAKDRNITLKTLGNGFVNINEINLLQVAHAAHDASKLVERWKSGYMNDVEETLRRLSEIIEGPRGLQRRMNFLEWGGGTVNGNRSRPDETNNGNGITRYRFQALTNRVQRLDRRLRRISRKLRFNECASDPCQNGGTCIDLYDSFHCHCPVEWQGSVCSVDVDECERYSGKPLGCQNGATCVNLPGTYRCTCAPGWHGIHCMTQKSSCDSNDAELCGHGICVKTNTPLGYNCICEQGWDHLEANNPACLKDIDECGEGRYPCSVNPLVACHNIPGTFFCGTCPVGYTGNGYKCQDIDECLVNNGGCSTTPFVECENTMGSRKCASCPSGYTGDGITCFYSGSCKSNNGGCHPLATCQESPGSEVLCVCPTGFQGTGKGPNGCEQLPNACRNHDCVHGTCRAVNDDVYVCNCNPGFTGLRCETILDPCTPNPCLNNGECKVGSWRNVVCNCTSGFTGARCELRRQACGGFMSSSSGYIEFPTGGGKYNSGHNCAWVIVTNSSQVLYITFTRFSLEQSNDCKYDYLQIHDGGTAGNAILGRFCGTELPKGGSITSSHNSLYFWFHSDNTGNHDGFAFNWTSIAPVCGGSLQADDGVISSPGSPGKYPPSRDCYWEIEANPGKRIMFTFFKLEIEEHPTCDFDYLEINETTYVGQNRLGLYCNHTRPSPVTSLGNRVTVHFHSDVSGSDAGFQLSYTTIASSRDCGGVFTSETGEIVSPGFHSGNYKAETICEWVIRLPENNRVKITFLEFDIESSTDCLFDLLQIFEGPNTNSPLVGKYCGSELPEPVVPNSNVILIRFESDDSLETAGFVLKYNVICGGEFNDPEGTIFSPYYPNPYPASKECTYLIAQPTGKAIVLTMQFMDIEEGMRLENGSPECSYDSLEIRDGDTENSTLIMTICGPSNMMPKEPIISSRNFMYLRFITDKSINNVGFFANYTTIDRDCGGIIRTAPGTLDIPEKGKTLTYNMDCIWTIRAPKGHAVQINWLSFRTSGKNEDCGSDFIEILEDYGTSQQKSMGKYCYVKKPPQVLASQGTGLTIHFHSTEITDQHYQASYNFIDASRICGGHYYSDAGHIASPNYPNSYPRNKECIWIIEASNRHLVELRIKHFKLETHSNCEFDYLEIRSGAYENSPLIGTFCGETIPKEISSMTNQMYIKFVSDSSLSDEGFEIEWNSRTSGCGGELITSSGSFISPNYPQPYHHKALCTWNIRVAAGSLVQILFIDLDIEYQDRCSYDYLMIAAIVNGYPKNPQRYCGKTAPPLLTLESNLVKAVFRSDILTSERGFHVRYVTECHNKLTGFRGVIESPNFPREYDNRVNCTWTIEVPQGNRVNVTFSHFELEKTDSNCSSDFVQLHEGDGDVANTFIGKYCGNEDDIALPLKITSTQRQVFVSFQTDGSLTYTGFRLEWAVHGCSEHLKRPNGFFSSPGYPNSYDFNEPAVECEWLIEVDRDRSIEITFTSVEICKKHVCPSDAMAVYNGADTSDPKIGELCYSQTPIVLTSTGNQLFVKYLAESYTAGKGFSARYRSVNLKCGGRFTAQYGTIHSANYPQNYPHSQNCEWLLKVDENHAINLTFVDFDMESSKNCSDDYVKVFDGSTRYAPLLGTHCGTQSALPTYTSSGNTMLVVMRSDPLISAKGFKAEYGRACGARIIVKNEGVIKSSPTLHHHKEANCSWRLVAENPGDRVTLIFNHMDFLTYNEDCSDNYVQVLDGDGTEGPVLATLCNNNVPSAIVSSGNALTIHMLSVYEIINGDNFQATYSVLTSACGGNFTSENGTFTSPGYPESYPTNIECVWILRTSPGNRVNINFEDFELLDSENCETDYLEIREVDGIGFLHGVFCGTNIQSITSSKQLWLKFRSGKTTSGTPKGFKAFFSFLHGNELTGDSGEIASPLYPAPYRRFNVFTWRVTVDFKWAVRIEFLDFYMENSGDYCFSSLKFYDGYNYDAPLIVEKCGLTKPEPIQSSGNVMFIAMSTYYDSVGSWFRLKWLKVPVELGGNTETEISPCTEVISLVEGNSTYALKSPGWPGGYSNNLKCSWTIMSPVGTHLTIRFQQVDIEESEGCITDYIAVYSGAITTFDSNEHLVSKVCSSSSSMSMVSASNVMTVQFVSDSSENKTGFSAAVARECGGSMEGPNGVIDINNSTKLSGFYRQWGFRCEWNITVRTGRKIAVKVTELSINDAQKSADKSCMQNFLMLKNGETASSPLLGQGKYCEVTMSSIILNTTGNHLYVKLEVTHSDVRFKLTYREIGADCGGRFIISSKTGEPEVTISSPNYPNIPSPHTECIWIFMAPDGKRLSIHFIERFDLLYSRNCEKEYVEVRDGGTEMSQSLGIFCKGEAPSSVITHGNMMYVHYVTDVTEPRNGFKAVIQAGACGGIIRDRRGVISSPNYPQPYPFNEDYCGWWIIGPADHGLKIQFEDINLPHNRNCSTGDYVSIMEKQAGNFSGNQIGKYCGRWNPGVIDILTNEALVYFITNAERGIHGKGFRLNFTSNRELCGSTLNGMNGEFKTTGYPRESHYRYCLWRITVPLGFRVAVEFLDFDLGGDPYSATGQASFSHDPSSISTIKRVRNITPNERIMSSSNYMLVYYYSTVGHRGVHGRFTAVSPAPCGGALTDLSGTLTNPAMYSNASYYCKWTLNPPEGLVSADDENGLTLAVKTTGFINRERISLFCSYFLGYISIKTNARPLARICGNLTTEPIYVRAPFNSYTIEAVNGTYGNRVNFKLEYKWHQCGGFLKGPSDIISAPKNLTYPVECAWSIQYPDDEETISLTFTRLNLGPCHKSFILVRNGNGRSPEIGKYCGNMNNGNLTSSTHRLWIEYYALEGPSDFEIRLESHGFSCGGILRNRRDFASPGFPRQYPSNTECTWELYASENYHIGLSFIERFNIETSPNCTNDFLQVFDMLQDENSEGEEWRDLGKVCGREAPKVFNSTSNRMKVVFRSNDKLEADGFHAIWNVNCGGSYNVTNVPKYLTSPRYPRSYDRSLNCKYTLYAPPGKEILVEFKDFNIEASENCQYDNLTITTYEHNVVVTDGVWCGVDTPPLRRSNTRMDLVFKSDRSVARRGFQFKYSINECGGNITSPQIINPVLHNFEYYTSLNCTWVVTAPREKNVQVKFEEFVFPRHIGCRYDSLSIYEGSLINATNIKGKFCGNLTGFLPNIKSSGNSLTIAFVINFGSDDVILFKAAILFLNGPQAGCGGDINLKGSKDFQTQLRSRYLPLEECHWMVYADLDNTITLSINEMDLRENPDDSKNHTCTADYIEVRDGGPFAELIGRYCGNVPPGPITSSLNRMWIRFVSDGTGDGRGVKGTLLSVPSICGPQTLSVGNDSNPAQMQILTSPNYPRSYPTEITCRWVISSMNARNKIHVVFNDFNLEDSENCDTDYLQVTDLRIREYIDEGFGEKLIVGGDQWRPRNLIVTSRLPTAAYKYCGTNLPHDYYSGGKDVELKYRKSAGSKLKGFKLSYGLLGCSRNFTSTQGRIIHDRFSECWVTIEVPENNTISLYFSHISLPYDSTCDKSRIEVRDGLDINDKIILSACGYATPSPVFSMGNKLSLHSFAKGTVFRSYYDITYTSSDKGRGCGGKIFNYGGVFTSPFYPEPYRIDSQCTWDISVPKGHKISLQFSDFNIGPKGNCNSVYISIFNVKSDGEQELAITHCGGETPANFQSTGNAVSILYSSTVNNGGSGWVIHFVASSGDQFSTNSHYRLYT